MWLRLIRVFLFTSPISRFHARPVIPRNCVHLLSQHKKVHMLTYRSPLSQRARRTKSTYVTYPSYSKNFGDKLPPLKLPTRFLDQNYIHPLEWIKSLTKSINPYFHTIPSHLVQSQSNLHRNSHTSRIHLRNTPKPESKIEKSRERFSSNSLEEKEREKDGVRGPPLSRRGPFFREKR